MKVKQETRLQKKLQPGSHTFVVKIRDSFLLMYENECDIRLLLHWFMEFARSHRPEEVVPDSYGKSEPGPNGRISS